MVVVTLGVVSLAGCGLLGGGSRDDGEKGQEGKDEAERAEPASVRVVGEIASVHPGEGFVLIRRHARAYFGEGNTLASLGPDGGTASLQLTGERLGRFLAADIREGTPAKGDLVIVRTLPEGSEAASSPVPEVGNPASEASWGKNIPPPRL